MYNTKCRKWQTHYSLQNSSVQPERNSFSFFVYYFSLRLPTPHYEKPHKAFRRLCRTDYCTQIIPLVLAVGRAREVKSKSVIEPRYEYAHSQQKLRSRIWVKYSHSPLLRHSSAVHCALNVFKKLTNRDLAVITLRLRQIFFRWIPTHFGTTLRERDRR